jgi:hypothetical protein
MTHAHMHAQRTHAHKHKHKHTPVAVHTPVAAHVSPLTPSCARSARRPVQAVRAAADGRGDKGGDASREKIVATAAAAKASKRSWDVSTLLNDDQRQAVAELAELFVERPPARAEWNAPLPEGAVDGGEGAQDGVPSDELSIAALYRKLGEAQEGADMFDEDDLSDVRDHHARMLGVVQLCDKIVGLLTIVEKTLEGLEDKHNAVVHKTSALHAECEKLLNDKLELEAMANTIQNRLKVRPHTHTHTHTHTCIYVYVCVYIYMYI